jgi:hypothetical protein
VSVSFSILLSLFLFFFHFLFLFHFLCLFLFLFFDDNLLIFLVISYYFTWFDLEFWYVSNDVNLIKIKFI